MKYYIDETFEPKDKTSWTKLLNHFISSADAIDFNILYDDDDLDKIREQFKEDIIECAVTEEPISDKAASLAIKYIKDDSTTKSGSATTALIEMIQSRVPKN